MHDPLAIIEGIGQESAATTQASPDGPVPESLPTIEGVAGDSSGHPQGSVDLILCPLVEIPAPPECLQVVDISAMIPKDTSRQTAMGEREREREREIEREIERERERERREQQQHTNKTCIRPQSARFGGIRAGVMRPTACILWKDIRQTLQG